MISVETKQNMAQYFPIHDCKRWPTLALPRGHLMKKRVSGLMAPSRLNTEASENLTHHIYHVYICEHHRLTGEPAYLHSLVRAFTALTHKIRKYM